MARNFPVLLFRVETFFSQTSPFIESLSVNGLWVWTCGMSHGRPNGFEWNAALIPQKGN